MIKPANGLLRSLNRESNNLSKMFKKISSGKRVVNAVDDAAGLAIAKALETETTVSRQARRNISDGVSALRIADGAMQQIGDIGGRMAELAAQAANGTISDQQRSALNAEYQQLAQEAQRITETTEFNGINLFKDGGITLQSGVDGSENSQTAALGENTVSQVTDSLSGLDLSSAEGARAGLDQIRTSISDLSQTRGEVGAVMSRLDASFNNLITKEENNAAAQSRIEDLDMAQAVAQKNATEIRQNITTSLVAQAGQLQGQNVLALLS